MVFVTPTKEHGLLAGLKTGPGEWEMFAPGDRIEMPEDRANRLMARGIVEEIMPPIEDLEGSSDLKDGRVLIMKKQKRRGKK